jgi:SAM-dependent methyltransferase
MQKRRSLKLPYDPNYEKNAYDGDYYDDHEKYYERGMPFFIKFLKENFQFASMADIGCGNGAFSAPLQDEKKVFGFDFSVGAEEKQKLRPENFHLADFSIEGSTSIAQCVDLVISLEVAEHIFPEFEKIYLGNVFGLGAKHVLLSWAVPGQIGRRHVNLKTREEVLQTVNESFPMYEPNYELTEKFKHIRYLASFYRNNTVVFERKYDI